MEGDFTQNPVQPSERRDFECNRDVSPIDVSIAGQLASVH
jgi:hypothetical protein